MKNLSMRMKLFVVGLVIGLIPMLSVGGITYFSAVNEIETSVLNTNTVFATLTKDHLTAYFEERKGDGNVIASSDSLMLNMEVIKSDSSTEDESQIAVKKLTDYLTLITSEYGYTDIFITDETGTVALSVNYQDSLGDVDLTKRAYVNEVLKGNQAWSKLFYSEYVEQNIIVLGNPIINPTTGEVIATLNLLLRQTALNDIIHEGVEELGETGDSYLINSNGLLMTETMLG